MMIAIPKYSRRRFIQVSSLASAALWVPQFLRSAAAAPPRPFNGRRLVIVQLSGGNDGLNCVVPYRDDRYYRNRPALALSDDDLIRLSDDVALNSKLAGLADLFERGQLSILNGVGYPNPNRSHFRSMDIWQSASDADAYVQTGWVGRLLDAQCGASCPPHRAIEIDDTLSLALKGDRVKGMAFRNPAALQASARIPVIREIGRAYRPDPSDTSYVEFLYKTVAETTQSAEYLNGVSKGYTSRKSYPQHDFGRRMKLIAELIVSGSETPVYYISLSGFDTHVLQKGPHGRLLKTYADTLRVFCDDLHEHGTFGDTVVLTFSEFGRRLKQNAGKGTDHGTANNVFVAGGSLKKAGLYNSLPSLDVPDNGDLAFEIDFRAVYATLLQGWLGVDAEAVLGRPFAGLGFV